MKKNILISIVLLSLGFVNTIYAEEPVKGPTAQQTIDFLLAKASCRGTAIKAMKIMNDRLMIVEYTDFFSTALLSDLSPEITVGNNGVIELLCSSNKCFDGVSDGLSIFNSESFYSDNKKTIKKYGYQLYNFCDKTSAKKAAKGFSHLIKLYGGKKELF